MLSFECPACHAKCAVDDSFKGRKLKCPKCGTRIKHHLDGSIELLSLGEVASKAATQPAGAVEIPTAPLSPPPSASVDPAPANPPQATGAVTQFSRRSESTQNWVLLAVIGVVVVTIVVALGVLLKNWIVAAGGLALVFGVAFAVLYLRSSRKDRMAAALAAELAAKNKPAPPG